VPLEDDSAREVPSSGRKSGRHRSLPKPEKKPKRVQRSAPGPDESLTAALRAWRLAEARRRGIPAFRILTDRTLAGLAEERPANEEELLAVPGMGPKLVERHGAQLLKIVAPRSAR
jgi:DNA topoisomerase III